MHGAIVFRRHRSPQERIDTERTEVIRGDEERTRVMTFTSPKHRPCRAREAGHIRKLRHTPGQQFAHGIGERAVGLHAVKDGRIAAATMHRNS